MFSEVFCDVLFTRDVLFSIEYFNDYISHNTTVHFPWKRSGVQRVQQHHSGSVCQQNCACVGDLCGVSGDMMSVRMMVGAGGAGLVLRASPGGLMRVARSRCAGQRQQTRAASAEVSVAEVPWKTLGLGQRSTSLTGWEMIKYASDKIFFLNRDTIFRATFFF